MEGFLGSSLLYKRLDVDYFGRVKDGQAKIISFIFLEASLRLEGISNDPANKRGSTY
jgi:hypothetical protein